MTVTRKRVSLTRADYGSIVDYDPHQDPAPSRDELVAAIERIQALVTAGLEHEQGRPEPASGRRRGLPHALHLDDIAQWEERFRRDAPTGAPDDCWPWQGRLDRNGYATLTVRDAGKVRALVPHRMAWVFANRQSIPEGLTIDHLCRTRSCLNPAHLEIVSLAENTRRKPLQKRSTSWGNPTNQAACPNCNSVFHRSYLKHHTCR